MVAQTLGYLASRLHLLLWQCLCDSQCCHAMIGLQKLTLTCFSCNSACADSCAGITGGCLQDDLRLTKGGSSCTPILEGASCGSGKTCQNGYCGGECFCCLGAEEGAPSWYAPSSGPSQLCICHRDRFLQLYTTDVPLTAAMDVEL
jgi:hypothetical protein